MAQVKVNPTVSAKKKPRVAQEKKGSGFVGRTTSGKVNNQKKSNFGETIMYLLIFGLVSIFFLNFMGVLRIPFLQFTRLGAKEATQKLEEASSETSPSSQEEQVSVYEGPRLETVDEGKTVVIPQGIEGTKIESEVDKSGIEVTIGEEVTPSDTGEDSFSSPREKTPGAELNPDNVYRVAKVYSAMEPQEAVQILEQFSDEEVVVILSAMKERQVAEILKAFPVERAATIARKMMEGR
ncbi:MAG: MotE family protein [Candidatus Caldatribacteriaceae bacterium]